MSEGKTSGEQAVVNEALNEEQLEAVAGGMRIAGNGMPGALQFQLQQATAEYQRANKTASDVQQKQNDTFGPIIRNIGG